MVKTSGHTSVPNWNDPRRVKHRKYVFFRYISLLLKEYSEEIFENDFTLIFNPLKWKNILCAKIITEKKRKKKPHKVQNIFWCSTVFRVGGKQWHWLFGMCILRPWTRWQSLLPWREVFHIDRQIETLPGLSRAERQAEDLYHAGMHFTNWYYQLLSNRTNNVELAVRELKTFFQTSLVHFNQFVRIAFPNF